jgi:hypothetical protein
MGMKFSFGLSGYVEKWELTLCAFFTLISISLFRRPSSEKIFDFTHSFQPNYVDVDVAECSTDLHYYDLAFTDLHIKFFALGFKLSVCS